MEILLLAGLCLSLMGRGLSQNPLCDTDSNSNGLITSPVGGTILVDTTVDTDPVCIRCGKFGGIFTDPNEVQYIFGGNTVTSTTPGYNITDEGLIVDDPASTFTDGEEGSCVVTSESINNGITINFLVFNPPSITPDTSLLDITEGNSTTLTCTRDSTNTNNDQYRWTLPDGTFSPPQPASSPQSLMVSAINRDESGLYVCTGTRPGTTDTVNATITINVQYSPKVLSFTPTNTTVVAGSNVTLNCSYEGNPSPTVSWSHNETMLDISDPNLSEILNDGYALLAVTFADINDTGSYGCGLQNIIDISNSEFFFHTVQVAPGPVATLQNDSITDVCVTLSWSFGFNGNAPITGVYITYTETSNYGSTQGGDETGTTSTNTKDTTSITICNLQPLTTYEFSVSVENEVSGTGTVGRSSVETISVTTLPLVPDAPTISSLVDTSSTELTVTWMVVVDTFTQTAIEGFGIRYNIVNDSTVNNVTVMDGAATSQLLSGLLKGTVYNVTVIATNSAGESPASVSMQQRTDVDPPSAVTNLMPTSNPFSICIQWAEPDDNGGQPIEEYRVELWNMDKYPNENFVFVTDVGSNVFTYTVENLDNGTDYSVRLSASNEEAGFGATDAVNATTGGALLVDPDFMVTVSMVTAITAHVNWTVPAVNGNTQYRLQIREETENSFDPDQFTNFTGSIRNTSLTNLSPNTSYELRMTRIEGEGCTRRVTEIEGFETLELEVEISGPPNVTAGNQVVLTCLLTTGERAPDVMWSRVSGGEIPTDAIISGATLTIPSPVEDDSGEYVCTSRQGTPDETAFTFSLIVLPRPTTPTPTPTTSASPATDGTESFPVWAIGVVAVGAVICIVVFIIVLIVFLYFCFCRGAKAEKSSKRYDLAKSAQKSSTTGMWLDEGASGFASIPQYQESEPENTPVGRGRTMTNDYVSATSFNTIDKKGSKERLTDLNEEKAGFQTDV